MFDTKYNITLYGSNVIVIYVSEKDFFNEINCKKSLILIKYMKDDFHNYLPTVMFRGTQTPTFKESSYSMLNLATVLKQILLDENLKFLV